MVNPIEFIARVLEIAELCFCCLLSVSLETGGRLIGMTGIDVAKPVTEEDVAVEVPDDDVGVLLETETLEAFAFASEFVCS